LEDRYYTDCCGKTNGKQAKMQERLACPQKLTVLEILLQNVLYS
jgi:hypothetical protein